MLSGLEIRKYLGSAITIEPYVNEQLACNSYNLRLHPELLVYNAFPLDMKGTNSADRLIVPESGLEICPQRLYLGRSVEYVDIQGLVPIAEAPPALSRLGLTLQSTTSLHKSEFSGYWTFAFSCVHGLRIYPNITICELQFWSLESNFRFENRIDLRKHNIAPIQLYMDFSTALPVY